MYKRQGQNGAGKSTLSNVLVGHPAYEVTRGSITFNGKDLLARSPEDRAHEGIFLSFQAPVEIPGVSMVNFTVSYTHLERSGKSGRGEEGGGTGSCRNAETGTCSCSPTGTTAATGGTAGI